MSFNRISNILGISLVLACKWFKNYKQNGQQGIKNKKRGVRPRTNSKLNNIQTEELKKMPSNINISYCLLSRLAIKDLILTVCCIIIPLRTITDYMKRLNFTLQKPIRRLYKQDLRLIGEWIKISFQKI